MHRRIILSVGLLIGTAHAAEPTLPFSEKGFAGARQPQLAVSPGGQVSLVVGVKNAVYCVSSGDGGKTWGDPGKVGEANALSLGMRRGPRVAASVAALVVTAIGGAVGKGRDGDVLAWRSADGGKTWKGPGKVNTVEGSAREGLHGMACGPDGTFCCVWLDLRDRNKMQVWGAFSSDGGETWKGEKKLYASPDGSVCECCHPSVAYDAKGRLHVLWRNALKGDRDMYLMTSEDGGKTFGQAVLLGEGKWELKACPMDGGYVAADAEGKVETFWMRKKEVFRCRPGEAEKKVGAGEQGWVAAGPAGFYLVWVSARPGELRALVPGTDKPLSLSRTGNDPVVAGALDGKGPVIAAWEEGKAPGVTIKAAILKERR